MGLQMSERGVFAVDRGVWAHYLLASKDPFSRREAWLWLVSEAAWKPHRRRLAGRLVELRRAQLAASLRFIAEKWSWSEPRVRRFLKLLQNEGMIEVAADAGVTVITICKYDKYQRVSLPDDASTDAASTQDRRKVKDTECKEDSIAVAPEKTGERIEIEVRAGPAPFLSLHGSISDEAFTLAREVIDIIGPSAAGNIIEVGAPAHCQKWLNEGWKHDFCLLVVRQVMSRRGCDNPPYTLKFFDKAISQYHAQMAEPLPKTIIKPQERSYAYASSHGARRSQVNRAENPKLAGLRRLAESIGGIGDDELGTKKHLQQPLSNSMREAAREIVASLNRVLTPDDPIGAKKHRLLLIGRLLMAYPGDTTEEGTIARRAVYLESLDDIPPWALDAAIRQWNRHEAGDQNYAFAPPPAILRRLALSHMATAQLAVKKIQEVLDAAPSYDSALRADSLLAARYANFQFSQLSGAKVE
jgi:hypothetical protein